MYSVYNWFGKGFFLMSKIGGSIPQDTLLRVSFLTQEIRKHDALYYDQNSPQIDDFEYDLLLRELLALEKIYPALITPDSPTQTLADRVLELFPLYQRDIPMLSLNNALHEQEARKFYESFSKNLLHEPNLFYVSPKFDGVAVELIYKKGVLKIASTRGTGLVGEDITLIIKNIFAHIPPTIPENHEISIRGELVLPKKELHKLNAEREHRGLTLLVNSRNAAAGLIRSIDFSSLKEVQFLFFPYWCAGTPLDHADTHEKRMDLLHNWGFAKSSFEATCDSFEQMQTVYQELLSKRDTLSFDLDGMVILANSLQLQKELGLSGKYPRYAIAWKFPPNIGEAQIVDLFWNIGAKGKITPVAQVTPVVLSGAKVQRVTLHNIDYIQKKDIRLKDFVHIVRSGDVIPRILDVITEKRPSNTLPISVPSICPSCQQSLCWEVSNFRMDFHCPNESLHPKNWKNQDKFLIFENFFLPTAQPCQSLACTAIQATPTCELATDTFVCTTKWEEQAFYKINLEHLMLQENDATNEKTIFSSLANSYSLRLICSNCRSDLSPPVALSLKKEASSKKISPTCNCFDLPTTKRLQNTNNISLMCINKNCFGVRLAKLKIFCGQSGLDIENLGKSQLELLFKKNIIQKPSDLYQLNRESLQNLEGFGDKKISNLLQSILASKSQPCKKFLCAMNIPCIEAITAEKICKEISKLPNIPQDPSTFVQALYKLATSSEYNKKEIGKQLYSFLSDADSVSELRKVAEQMDFFHPNFWGQKQSTLVTPISGKILVFTGSMQMPRHIARERAEKLGATVYTSLTSDTEILVVGDKPGSKLIKAQELQISILQEQEFLHLIQTFL